MTDKQLREENEGVTEESVCLTVEFEHIGSVVFKADEVKVLTRLAESQGMSLDEYLAWTIGEASKNVGSGQKVPVLAVISGIKG